MNKIYYAIFILALLLALSESADSKTIKSNSKLIEMVRKEIIDKAMAYLPKREDYNILQMLNQFKKAKEEFSLNDAESAYFVYKWISNNIRGNLDNEEEDIAKVYESGIGNVIGIASLFNRMCSFLNLESGSIPGFIKYLNITEENEITEYIEFTWNYFVINGENYLINVAIGCDFERLEYNSIYKDRFFGMDPEDFIRFHYPKESKWQLLPEPITFEKFLSKAIIFPFFYWFDIKSISPDTNRLKESGTITITYDESDPIIDIETLAQNIISQNVEKINEYEISNGKVEVKYDLNNINANVIIISIKTKNLDDYLPILFYIVDYNTKKSSLNLRRISTSNSKIKNFNDFLQKSF